MSLSPALESESVTADAVVTASRFCIGGQWFSYNRRIRFATTAPHPGGKRGDWISVERGRTFSTSSVIVVAKDDSRYIVAPIPGCIALIEICSSLGLSFYVNKSTDVSFPPNTSLLVREVRATCVGHAVVKGPIDTGTVVAPYGNKQIKLGKIGVLVCEVCKIGFDTIEECLLHFELPTVEVNYFIFYIFFLENVYDDSSYSHKCNVMHFATQFLFR